MHVAITKVKVAERKGNLLVGVLIILDREIMVKGRISIWKPHLAKCDPFYRHLQEIDSLL